MVRIIAVFVLLKNKRLRLGVRRNYLKRVISISYDCSNIPKMLN